MKDRALGAALEEMIREMIREEVRTVVREEIGAALSTIKGEPTAQRAGYFSVADAAKHASVSQRTIRRWISDGDLQGFRAGRVLRIHARDLESFLARQSSNTPTRDEIREKARAIMASH